MGKLNEPKLNITGWFRWAWRQLTTMRTALFLLMLLAIAAVPGSFFPQRAVNPQQVALYLEERPGLGGFLEWLQFFDVYNSVWFSAIYLLLFISLIGCVVPRAIQHIRSMARKPPRTPQQLSRLPEHGIVSVANPQGSDKKAVAEKVRGLLKGRRLRTEEYDISGTVSIAAESTILREAGNITFHLALVGILVFSALNGLFGYSGQRVMVEGETFVNSLIQYDDFRPGRSFSQENLDPFSVKLDKFNVQYDTAQDKLGSPIYYRADVHLRERPGGENAERTLSVNHPLRVGGASAYLVGNGYAPVVTVRDHDGRIAFQGPVVSLPQGGFMDSQFALKVPDASPQQLGFYGFFLPSAQKKPDGAAASVFPGLVNPELHLNSYYGDLGLNDGQAQNIYDLDTTKLNELNSRKSRYGGIALSLGKTYNLPEGMGSISFDGVKRFIALDIAHAPGKTGILCCAVIGVAGLILSLFAGRRRLWVKILDTGDDITLEYGLLARGDDFRLKDEAQRLKNALRQAV